VISSNVNKQKEQRGKNRMIKEKSANITASITSSCASCSQKDELIAMKDEVIARLISENTFVEG
jgi:hypothetical protein